MNINVLNAECISAKFSQQITACIGSLLRNEIQVNSNEQKEIRIRKDGLVVGQISIKNTGTDIEISFLDEF